LKEWTTLDCRNTSSTTNLEEEEIVDAPGNDGNASMPEQVRRPNPWRKMMMMNIYSLYMLFYYLFPLFLNDFSILCPGCQTYTVLTAEDITLTFDKPVKCPCLSTMRTHDGKLA